MCIYAFIYIIYNLYLGNKYLFQLRILLRYPTEGWYLILLFIYSDLYVDIFCIDNT